MSYDCEVIVKAQTKNYGECLKHYFLFKRGLSEEIEFENIRVFFNIKTKRRGSRADYKFIFERD